MTSPHDALAAALHDALCVQNVPLHGDKVSHGGAAILAARDGWVLVSAETLAAALHEVRPIRCPSVETEPHGPQAHRHMDDARAIIAALWPSWKERRHRIEAEAVKRERARLAEAVKADWLATGPWQNFDGYETAGDPYRRVLALLEPDSQDPERLDGWTRREVGPLRERQRDSCVKREAGR